MANQWFRMYAEFATDPKVQMLSEANQRRYVMLLCLRCSNGDVTLHDEEIAFQLRISPEEWAATKATLVAKKLITEDNRPTAWDKRQYVSDSSAARVAAHRARKKADKKPACNVTETPPDTETDTELNPSPNAHEAIAAEAEQVTAKPDAGSPFVMTLDWEPDQNKLAALALCAGLPLAAFTREAVGGFKAHHEASCLTKSSGQWHAALLNWVKRDHVRDARVVQMPSRRAATAPPEDWAAEGVVL